MHRILLSSFFRAEKAMAPHSSTLAWKIPWMEEPGGPQSMGSLRVGHDWWLHFHFSLSCIGEGNGNPLQCSCLENPRDGGAWWAAVFGVTQSQTRLKWLSSSSGQVRQGVRFKDKGGSEAPLIVRVPVLPSTRGQVLSTSSSNLSSPHCHFLVFLSIPIHWYEWSNTPRQSQICSVCTCILI